MAKNKVGPVAVYLSKELLNGMLCCLDYLIACDESHGEWETHAKRLKEKILRHGRKFVSEGVESVAIYFYENEAAILLKAFSLFIYCVEYPQKDYIGEFKMRKKEEAPDE